MKNKNNRKPENTVGMLSVCVQPFLNPAVRTISQVRRCKKKPRPMKKKSEDKVAWRVYSVFRPDPSENHGNNVMRKCDKTIEMPPCNVLSAKEKRGGEGQNCVVLIAGECDVGEGQLDKMQLMPLTVVAVGSSTAIEPSRGPHIAATLHAQQSLVQWQRP